MWPQNVLIAQVFLGKRAAEVLPSIAVIDSEAQFARVGDDTKADLSRRGKRLASIGAQGHRIRTVIADEHICDALSILLVKPHQQGNIAARIVHCDHARRLVIVTRRHVHMGHGLKRKILDSADDKRLVKQRAQRVVSRKDQPVRLVDSHTQIVYNAWGQPFFTPQIAIRIKRRFVGGVTAVRLALGAGCDTGRSRNRQLGFAAASGKARPTVNPINTLQSRLAPQRRRRRSRKMTSTKMAGVPRAIGSLDKIAVAAL